MNVQENKPELILVEKLFRGVEGEGGIALQDPDLPGIVLIVTGGLASLLSLGWWHKRQLQILATLVVLTTAMVVLHRLWHHLGVSHDWLEPFYGGTIVVYCGVAISVSRRLLRRDAGLPPA